MLIDDHGPAVHRFLVASLGRPDAEDCYQETWLAALRAYPGLSDASNLRAWILTVAHHKAIDQTRIRGRRPVPVAETPEVADPDPGPGLDRAAEIWIRVRALPVRQRTAVALRFINDAAYAEIAEVMGGSEAAARRNVHEALKRLRRELQHD